MELWQKIVEVYPVIAENDFAVFNNQIILQDDSDGQGAYIREWNYSEPLPEGLKIGK